MITYDDLMDDIGNKLREDYNIEPCTDNSQIDLQDIVTEAQNILNNGEVSDDKYWDMIHIVIEQYIGKVGAS